MSAQAVAGAILAGVERGHVHIIPGLESKLVAWAARRFPWLTRTFVDATLRKAERALASGS